MPQISQQKVGPRQPIKRTISGSFLDRAVPVTSLEQAEHYQMTFYGVNRIGKTTLICQFPKPMLLISNSTRINGGADSVRKFPGIEQLRQGEHFNGSDDVLAIGKELQGGHKYASIGVEDVTSLEETMLAEICGWDQTAEMLRFGKVTQDQYTERSERLRKVLRPFLDLRGCNVLITANEKDHNPQESRKAKLVRGPEAESKFGPAFGSGAVRWLLDSCNWIVQLYYDKEVTINRSEVTVAGRKSVQEEVVETGKIVRRARLKLHPNFLAGCCAPYVNDDSIPEYVEAKTPKEIYDKIMSVARGIKVK